MHDVGLQEDLLALGFASGKPVVVLTFTTSPKNGAWVRQAEAILHAGYPQSGGASALADTLLGHVSPGGRLPVSWPKAWNCSITPDPNHPGKTSGRCEIQPSRLIGSGLTYRFGAEPLFPFGYGLSYSSWNYSELKVSTTVQTCSNMTATVVVTNTGHMAAAETVQAYVQWIAPSVPAAEIQLVAFEKVYLQAGESSKVTLTMPPRQLALLRNASTTHSTYLDDLYANHSMVPPVWVSEQVRIKLWVGGQQPNQMTSAASNVLLADVEVIGNSSPIAECPGHYGSAY